MMRFLVFLTLTSIIWLFCAQKVLAVTLSLDAIPSKITTSEFEISVSITGAKPATNYLKALVYKEGTHDYVGQTWNGNEWYNGPEGKNYLPITISGKTVNTKLKIQIAPDAENGEYLLSVKRFTASGNSADDSITEVHLFLEFPKTEPTKSPSTPSPTPQPTPVPSIVNTMEPTIEPEIIPPPATPSVVLAAETETAPNKTDEPLQTIQPSTNNGEFTLGIFLFTGGLGCILFGSCLIIKRVRQLV